MDRIFFTILNMSLTGAFVILAIILARLLLKKAPKIVSYCLWAVAGFRLLFPFSIESIYSLVPFNTAPIPPDIATQTVPRLESGFVAIDNIVSNAMPLATQDHSANPLQILTTVSTFVWLAGIAIMLAYGIVSYIALKRKMQNSSGIDNIYESDEVKSPFVLGIIKPKIYLPTGLSAKEREYIILHEQTHIRRQDHIIKFAAYFVLCLHWFNPLAWVAYILMTVDMELSCDERVLKEIGDDAIKKDYSLSLLMLSANRPKLRSSPLAFSEDGLKTRIKNVLKYKKYSRVTIIAATALAIVLGVGLALNAAGDEDNHGAQEDVADYGVSAAESVSTDVADNEDIQNHAETDGSFQIGEMPSETPEYVVIIEETFQTDETEIWLDSLRVTDADLEQLKHMTNLQFLQIFPGINHNENTELNDGTINLELISELTSLTSLQIMCDVALGNMNDISPLAKLENLTHLRITEFSSEAANSQISDLSPLENMTNLNSLHLTIPNVSDLSPLTRMPSLHELGLLQIRNSDLSVLSEMPNLMFLQLFCDNSFGLSIDLSFLADLPTLESLSLSFSQIDDFSPLTELVNLNYLSVVNCGFSDLSVLSGLANLRNLWISNNSIQDISPLTGLSNLTHISLSSNELVDISALAGLNNLVFLNLHYNRISDISPLAELTNLAMLDITNNDISDLSPLSGLSNLSHLFLFHNPIEDVSALTELTRLEYVTLSYRQGFGSVRDLRAALPNVMILTEEATRLVR